MTSPVPAVLSLYRSDAPRAMAELYNRAGAGIIPHTPGTSSHGAKRASPDAVRRTTEFGQARLAEGARSLEDLSIGGVTRLPEGSRYRPDTPVTAVMSDAVGRWKGGDASATGMPERGTPVVARRYPARSPERSGRFAVQRDWTDESMQDTLLHLAAASGEPLKTGKVYRAETNYSKSGPNWDRMHEVAAGRSQLGDPASKYGYGSDRPRDEKFHVPLATWSTEGRDAAGYMSSGWNGPGSYGRGMMESVGPVRGVDLRAHSRVNEQDVVLSPSQFTPVSVEKKSIGGGEFPYVKVQQGRPNSPDLDFFSGMG